MSLARAVRTYLDNSADRPVEIAIDDELSNETRPSLWPSVGEYPVYDPFLYYLMTHDDIRNNSFRTALRAVAGGRSVLDIGTGQDLNWALEAVRNGARRVIAVEQIDESYAEARRLHADLPERAAIQLQHCTSFELMLDDPAEVCVAELIGTIASSEGMLATMADAHARLLRPGATVIPAACSTMAGAVSLRSIFPSGLAFASHTLPYLDTIFDSYGRAFDIRLAIANMDPNSVVSTTEPVEELVFDGSSPLDDVVDTRLKMLRDGQVDGIACWIRLDTGNDNRIVDSLVDRTNWIPVYFPLFDIPIPVSAGDVLAIRFERRTSDDGVHPDYLVHGELTTTSGTASGSTISRHHNGPLGGSAAHRELFSVQAR
ncbi:hypothetical protein [Amycolatopsis sp. NPDC054798]